MKFNVRTICMIAMLTAVTSVLSIMQIPRQRKKLFLLLHILKMWRKKTEKYYRLHIKQGISELQTAGKLF